MDPKSIDALTMSALTGDQKMVRERAVKRLETLAQRKDFPTHRCIKVAEAIAANLEDSNGDLDLDFLARVLFIERHGDIRSFSHVVRVLGEWFHSQVPMNALFGCLRSMCHRFDAPTLRIAHETMIRLLQNPNEGISADALRLLRETGWEAKTDNEILSVHLATRNWVQAFKTAEGIAQALRLIGSGETAFEAASVLESLGDGRCVAIYLRLLPDRKSACRERV